MDKNIALIFAGGTGSRMGNVNLPKQFLLLGGKPIIAHTLDHFQGHSLIDKIAVVCVEGWIKHLESIVEANNYTKVVSIVKGGDTGQQSIFNGLNAISKTCEVDDKTVVLIHDGVRPLIDESTITKCIDSVNEFGCTATTASAVETIIEEEDGKVARVVDRSRCKLARAPQGFRFAEIFDAHNKAREEGKTNFTDSVSLMSHYGFDIYTIEGPSNNIKITTRQDYFAFKGYMDYKEMGQLWS
ncbi:MAG: 2-C-methyl-D-erythritol 4-phosphate cytidylyltransferase [Streptococcus salivarius]|nr:2-C-methyl-D-erythritol 4-phosphate cytidylyltransferase [Streptococcus salivarius]